MTHISFVLKYFTAGLNCVQLGQHSQQIFARQTFRPPATAWMTTELHPQSAPLRMFESFLSFASQIVAPWPVYCLCVFSMEHGGYSQQPHTALLCLPLLAPAAPVRLCSPAVSPVLESALHTPPTSLSHHQAQELLHTANRTSSWPLQSY